MVSPSHDLRLYWKNTKGKHYKSLGGLKEELRSEGKELVFAMNAGMYLKDRSPQGLFIEAGRLIKPMDTVQEAFGNFYLQPNGVFYLKKNEAGVCVSQDFDSSGVSYATQSGPMLVIDGEIHPKFSKTSKHLNIRNGVGILPNGDMLFVMSKEKVTLYNFAAYFRSKGCKNALYLDGYVSKTYLPEQNWRQEGGHFGVMIGQTKSMNN